MKKVELGFIYCLINPLNEEIFYIGCSESVPKDRLVGHYEGIKEREELGQSLTNVQDYLKSLLPHKAISKLLEIIIDDDLYRKEREYIKEFREYNPNLTNMTIGGKGGDTWTQQPNHRKEAIRLKVSLANKGKRNSDEAITRLSEQRKGPGNPAYGKPSKKSKPILVLDEDKRPIKVFYDINDVMLFTP